MIFLNLLDLVTTLYIVSHGGIEVNPFAAWLVSHGLFIWAKFFVGTGCFVRLEYQSKYHRSARIGKWVVIAMYAAIAINNFWTIGVMSR